MLVRNLDRRGDVVLRQPPIRSFEAWKKSLQNFEWISDKVPGATDVDMVLHASNPKGDHRYLVFEFKSPGQRLPRGQSMFLRSLQKQGWTVVCCWGPDSKGLFVLGWDWSGKVTKEELSEFVDEWWSDNKLAKKEAA